MSDFSMFPSTPHVPVMLAEVLAQLRPRADETYVDGTFGAGGYTSAILDSVPCQVVALDRDPSAFAAGQALVAKYQGRLKLVQRSFSEVVEALQDLGITKVDGLVLDIGVSSMQLDQAERGFSFLREGPLDMRMSQSGQSAADVVNTFAQDDLARVIYILGEEKKSRAIARAIVAARDVAPIRTTIELVKVIEGAIGPQRAHERIHPATRTFQALRIFVNAELDELAHALNASEDILQEGGRLVVVAFHSLEDRIVKRFLQSRGGFSPANSRHMPGQDDERPASFTLPFKGHLEASESETSRNPRARSAKLRAGIRTDAESWPHNNVEPVLGYPMARGRR
jgi:16S rRNA (cytosine1402-N4)-methyltransferase